ncbi:MAG: ABC transporter substrate-binding protein [Proteobacteria bacterium]|nr:ABC transporter substrate-binding protein [Pseudomonadota bacterium]MBI3499807.1 ABC transporter substrate-binding protein [Pseudomonadota bacterium]
MKLGSHWRIRLLLASAAATALVAGDASAQQFACPKKGGEIVFAQEAKVNSLDQHTSSTISTRNVAMNMFESLMTRDENFNPMPELAASVEESKDGMTYVFKLRDGIKFHNGKPMTTADVVATFDRYKKVGIDRGILDVVESWEAKDASTFILHMKVAQPTFLENFSSFSIPIVIVPAENAKAEPMQLATVGTGPFQFVEFVADSHVKMKRYDGYNADTRYKEIDGFGGYKQACVDSVNFRIVTEPGARVAGLETGELHGAEDVPTKSQERLKQNKDIVLKPLKNFWIQIATPNVSIPPTDNLKFRQAVQAAMDMDEVMEAATDGAYQLNIGFQYPGQNFYTEAGKETYNQKNAAKAKTLLAESGYKGEEMILLTNRDYTNMYNAALVMSEQLKAVGINAKLLVIDWPASVQMQQNTNTGWNWFFTGYGTNTALGGVAALRFHAPPFNTYKPKTPEDADKEFIAAFRAIENGKTLDERKAAFAKAQARVLDQVLALPFGSLTKVQAVRANVQNFKPFRIPRMSNVYFSG